MTILAEVTPVAADGGQRATPYELQSGLGLQTAVDFTINDLPTSASKPRAFQYAGTSTYL